MKKRIGKKLFAKLKNIRCDIFIKIRFRDAINFCYYKKIKGATKKISKCLNKYLSRKNKKNL